MAQVIAFFNTKGIDLTKYPISFDSWYGSEELVTLLTHKGFDQIAIRAKSRLCIHHWAKSSAIE